MDRKKHTDKQTDKWTSSPLWAAAQKTLLIEYVTCTKGVKGRRAGVDVSKFAKEGVDLMQWRLWQWLLHALHAS